MHISIGKRRVGNGHPALVVGELSGNHAGSLDIALATIDAMADAGADAVKLQTYTADTITLKSDKPLFRVNAGSIWDGRTLWDLYDEAHTPWEWHEELFRRADERGLLCFSSPFDPTAVEFLAELGAPAFKIASFEVTDIPLIRAAARTGKPVIISTGIGSETEIAEAVSACREEGCDDIIVLKCTSSYPARLEDSNIRTVADIPERFGTLAGYSDHTESSDAAAAAVVLGACMIEKHVILERDLGGPDAAFSATPDELRELISRVRRTETALGTIHYGVTDAGSGSRQFARSLFVVRDVVAGEVVSEANVRSIRPSNGLPPREWDRVVGAPFVQNVEAGTPLSMELLGHQ